ncbi:MAG: hypothetical protein KDA60_19415 [Planctomycetales bacterium]|nr:hypothetical protein [Planctomycetales bacterium]
MGLHEALGSAPTRAGMAPFLPLVEDAVGWAEQAIDCQFHGMDARWVRLKFRETEALARLHTGGYSPLLESLQYLYYGAALAIDLANDSVPSGQSSSQYERDAQAAFERMALALARHNR